MRGRRKKASFLQPIKLNLKARLSNTDTRVRRKILRMLIAVVGVFMIYSSFAGPYGFVRIIKLHLQMHRLTECNHRLLVDLVDTELTVKRLQADYRYIEHIARTRHYFARPGEVIYRIKE
ncbi:MAG: septum formation initiator family protein [Candidatus Zixiibacteriota bacterium]|nr:MAG: septum formation initiator family protein [candidate division Zixibacteria bacterium]